MSSMKLGHTAPPASCPRLHSSADAGFASNTAQAQQCMVASPKHL